jgi:hypothetical protein
MFVLCVFILFVLFCVWVEALERADPLSKESYRLSIVRSRNCKSGEGPTKRCRIIIIIIIIIITAVIFIRGLFLVPSTSI